MLSLGEGIGWCDSKLDFESLHRIGLDADAPAELCLIANGAYLGAAFILPVGDAADLIRLGVPVWAFAVPGILVFGAGLWVWDGLAEKGRAVRAFG